MKANVSICITCYNKEKYLDECVRSVVEQTILPKEIIVVHDACDNSAHHPDVKTVILPNNSGVVKARDEAFNISKGELILFLDADDKLSPNFIERSVWNIGKVDIVYPDILWWFEQRGENKYVESPKKLIAKSMYETCKIPVTSMMKRGVYEDLGGFRPYPIYEDWEFWLRAMSRSMRFKRINTFIWYRQLIGNRNRQDKGLKEQTYNKIRSQYQVVKGKICPK